MGNKGSMPWGDAPLDGRHFQNLTKGHVVLMGRKTFESIGYEPLPNRENIVLSRTMRPAGVYSTEHWADALRHYFRYSRGKDLWVIGGATVFEQFLPFIEEFYVTVVGDRFEGDTFLDMKHDVYRWHSELTGMEDIVVPKIPEMIMFDPIPGRIPAPDEHIQVDHYHLTYRRFTKELEPHVTEFLKAMYGKDTP